MFLSLSTKHESKRKKNRYHKQKKNKSKKYINKTTKSNYLSKPKRRKKLKTNSRQKYFNDWWICNESEEYIPKEWVDSDYGYATDLAEISSTGGPAYHSDDGIDDAYNANDIEYNYNNNNHIIYNDYNDYYYKAEDNITGYNYYYHETYDTFNNNNNKYYDTFDTFHTYNNDNKYHTNDTLVNTNLTTYNPDIKKEYEIAMNTNTIKKCYLKQQRNFDDDDLADIHFRRCESQFMRSCNHCNNRLNNNYNNGLNRTIEEVVYIINPLLIHNFENKKKEMCDRYNCNIKDLNIILGWHGTPKQNINNIVEYNFSLSNLSTNSGDCGWYGAGIYFSEYANVCSGYGDGLLLCKIILGKSYKMINRKTGCSKQPGYDSHIVSYNGQYGQEIVIFDMDQILPCYIVKY